jgi:hypothetical protein
MYNMGNFFSDQMQDPNSALFNPMGQSGQKSLVPPTAMAAGLGTNPNVTDTIQSLSQPGQGASAGAAASGVGPSASDQAGANAGQLDPMAMPQKQAPINGKDVNGMDFLKQYTGGGSGGGGGGGLLKLMAAFM